MNNKKEIKKRIPWNKGKKGLQKAWNKGLKGLRWQNISAMIIHNKENGVWNKGKKLPQLSGKNHWNYGNKMTEEKKEKLFNGHKKYIEENGSWWKGKKLSEEHIKNLKKSKENEKERLYRRNGNYVPCLTCGKVIYQNTSQLKQGSYCSLKCSPLKKRSSNHLIINGFIKEKLGLEDIRKKYGGSLPKIKNILYNYGITHDQIILRRNEYIGKKNKGLRKGKKMSEEIKNKMKKYWRSPIGRKQQREKRVNQIFPKKDTSIEVKIQNFLKQLGIEFFTHQYMKIEHGYQCDILIPSINLVIECDGDYWHKYPIGNDVDHIRTKELIEKGFKVLRLWEFEIKSMKLNDFKNVLQRRKK